jgi:hypothetical protein
MTASSGMSMRCHATKCAMRLALGIYRSDFTSNRSDSIPHCLASQHSSPNHGPSINVTGRPSKEKGTTRGLTVPGHHLVSVFLAANATGCRQYLQVLAPCPILKSVLPDARDVNVVFPVPVAPRTAMTNGRASTMADVRFDGTVRFNVGNQRFGAGNGGLSL